MKKIKLIFPIFIIFLLSGCYNYRELNQLAITSAVGIDKIEDNYTVTVQVTNTQKTGSDSNATGNQAKFITYTKSGRTIQEAIRNIILECPKRLYVNHISLLLVSENVAKEGIHDILDFFSRNTEFRKQFNVIVTKTDDTSEILNILTPLETLNAKKIKDSIVADARYLGLSQVVSFEDLLKTYLNKKTEFVLTSVKYKGDYKKGEKEDNLKESSPNTNIIVEPLAVFKNDKLKGYMSHDDSITYTYITNRVESSIVNSTCGEDKNLAVEITNSKTSLAHVKNKPVINLKVKSSGNIKEIHCDLDLTKNENIEKLQKNIEKKLKNDIEKTIKKNIEKYNSDIFGFEETIFKSDPKYYKKLKDQYKDDLLKNIEIKVSVDVGLFAKGNIIRVIKR